MDSDDEINSHLPERLKNTTISSQPITLFNDISDYFAEPHADDPDTWASDTWTLKPEIPSSDEIFGTDEEFVDLRTNKIEGPWESKDAYLKTHYELLREDSVAPLRDAVAIFRNDPDMCDNKSISIYEKVYVTALTFARRGLAFRVQFSTNRAGRNIAWEYSKRLVAGSMVALSPASDGFQTKCAIAIIAARPLDGVKLQPPEVDIFFANPADADFDPQLEWVMVEAKDGYYESARHTMMALQKMSRESFPLADQICFLKNKVEAPQYVKDHPVVEIESSINDSQEGGMVDILNSWPESPIGELDSSQWAALEQMLTRELAIIQGPPGTGKTYVSVVAFRIMLANRKPGDPPIIVASQTNHALDQILTYISRFERQYVRLGARSSDPEIKKRTLFAIRRDEPVPNIPRSVLSIAHRNSKRLFVAISDILQPFSAANSDKPIPCSAFRKHGILTTKQCESLEKGVKRWVCASDETDEVDPLVTWLGDQVEVFEVSYTTENFGFAEDEVDLEYEQLKELEAEQGLNEDDDYEALRGSTTYIHEGYYGRTDAIDVETGHWEYFNYDDMWKVPVKDRGWLYNELRKQLKGKILQQFRELLTEYSRNCKSFQIGGFERDNFILQNAKVLGMTTTGLSKYRALVSSVKPKIVLIEEAAEAIEAPVAAACLESVQQLILVGDHQQLRGHCSVQELEGDPFYLDVSMFERLVENGMKYITLERQRRMAPEIRQLLSPIYGQLQDHESVKQREEVPGMGNLRTFFFSHSWQESSDDLASKYNEKEAEMIVGFFVHLVLNNVSVKDITILTFYNGQRKKLLRMMKSHPYLQGEYIKVVTVDSYQGEENEVVILSLVRNGGKGIGFLSIANRISVALSRARRGFYIFGNAEQLAMADSLWGKVLFVLGNRNSDGQPRSGHDLPLTCVKHGNKIYIRDPADWPKTNGGCTLACGETLQCGHKCTVRCHSFSHDRIQCSEICNRQMACNHVCMVPCKSSHACSCNCDEARRIQYLAQPQAWETDNSGCVMPTRENKRSSKQQAAIEGYQSYARGGSKELDEILDQKAGALQQKQRSNPPLSLGQFREVDSISGATLRETGFGAQTDRDGGGSNAQAQQSLLD
ncbi:P-loop containing nucleoside triphosphate hydrolase protein [Aspergillus egyptiacus]|nr:P-loop containing nucleoside triphosphate hydrolase protein [Aspergillus egyptiacus]